MYGNLTGIDPELEEGLRGFVQFPVVDVAAEVKEGEGLSDDDPFVLDLPGACPRSDVFDHLDRPVPMAPTLIVGPPVLWGQECWEEEVVVLEEEEPIEGAYAVPEVLEGVPGDSGTVPLQTAMWEGECLEEVCNLF